MYHKSELFKKAYYDTLEEMPTTAKIYFPNEKEPRELSVTEMYKLSDEGWKTVMHTVNWGSCDHWCSVPLRKWVDSRFLRIIHYTSNGKENGTSIGYDRMEWSARLTKEDVWESSVWNS